MHRGPSSAEASSCAASRPRACAGFDLLPHQLEAVYDYLLKLARVRFLLADDAGAGKTIMAGLLARELQLRGLAERILIVCRRTWRSSGSAS